MWVVMRCWLAATPIRASVPPRRLRPRVQAVTPEVPRGSRRKTMATLDEGPIIELGRNPIPGDAPSGTDPGDDTNYIEVDAEMNKLGRIEAGEPDWYQIEQGCRTILSSLAKDAEVASWYGHALFKRNGYAGLAAAIALLTELIRNFWDNMYPARPRRRKARIETLADQFTEGQWFREQQPKTESDFDAVDLCVTRTEELKGALTEKMPDDPPELDKFIRGLQGQAGKRPKPEAPAPAAEAEAAAAPSAPAAAGAFAAGEIKDVSGASNALLSACTFLRNADPADPIPYAVVRIVKWAKISMPATEEAKYQIPPPEKTTVEALAHQLANNLWEHLLKGAEAAFRSNDPLWLDLQRYTCAAMTGYGPNYDKARQAVMAATAGLVNRLGEPLFELKFSNGTALCSGETKMWIETEVLPAAGGGGGGEGGGVGAADGRLAEAVTNAKKLAGSGKLKEGLKGLQEGLSQCMQRRDRFLWRLSIARLCFDAQRHQLAAPLLEQCYDDVQRFHIDDWEPSLAASVAETLYRCRKSLASGQKEPLPEDLKSVRDSFAWLCRLDPLAALAAEPSGK